MFYDEHWENLNEINRKSRPSKHIYDQKPERISNHLQKKIENDYAHMIKTLKKYKRFKVFLDSVEIRIRFFDDSDYYQSIEFGYPHTIMNTICLPISYSDLEKPRRIKLLIHESIHIYQRNFPFEFNKFLTEEFDLNIVNFSENMYANSRYNPDINRLIYADDGLYKVMVYNKKAPKSLVDSTLLERRISPKTRESNYERLIDHFKNVGVQEEHPYEVFACVISEYIFSKDCSCTLCEVMKQWLNASPKYI